MGRDDASDEDGLRRGGARSARLDAAPFVEQLRKQAFDEFRALPIPSQETEEWRYTDVEHFDFDLAPFAGRRKRGEPRRCSRGGPRGGRRRRGASRAADPAQLRGHGRPICCPSSTPRAFGSATSTKPAAEHPELRRAVPARARGDRPPEVHRAARGLPHRRHVPLRAARCPGRAAAPDADLPGRRRRRDLPSHPAGRRPRAPRSPSSTATSRRISSGALATPSSRSTSGTVRSVRYVGAPGVGRPGCSTSASSAPGSGATRTCDARRSRSAGRSRGPRSRRSSRETVGSSEMLGVYFGDGDQHFDHRSIQDHVGSRTSSDLLYKGRCATASSAIYTGTVSSSRARTSATRTRRTATSCSRSSAKATRSRTWRSSRTIRRGAATRRASVRSTRTSCST